MQLRFAATDEDLPGEKWRSHFVKTWPSYHTWFLKQGEGQRPSYLACRSALRAHMPELCPFWERLVELAGGGDHEARMLSLYCPTPYVSGCSQAIWNRGAPMLVRNYDYHPSLCEALLVKSRWNGVEVLGMSDCLWGLIDGMNHYGLAVSLAFGGRKVVGPGFGIPLVLRYVLQICQTANQAAEVLARIPCHMAYNVSVLDAQGAFLTLHLSPDRPMRVEGGAVATNHQGEVEWAGHAELTQSLERERYLQDRLADPSETAAGLVQRFLEPPVFSRSYARAHGTLYTAVYRPAALEAEYLWTAHRWTQSFRHFDEGEVLIHYDATATGAER